MSNIFEIIISSIIAPLISLFIGVVWYLLKKQKYMEIKLTEEGNKRHAVSIERIKELEEKVRVTEDKWEKEMLENRRLITDNLVQAKENLTLVTQNVDLINKNNTLVETNETLTIENNRLLQENKILFLQNQDLLVKIEAYINEKEAAIKSITENDKEENN